MDLKGKHIFITGANRGIGKAIAEEAARKGLTIYALCRSEPEGLADELRGLGAADVHYKHLDLGNKSAIDAFVKEVVHEGLPVDILVNNAGQLTGGLIENQEIDDIYRMLQVNLTGVIHLTHSLLPLMLKRPQAKIVNNSSVSGVMCLPCASTYAASKAGVVAFTNTIKQELRDTSVSTLLLITPGVKTRMYDEIPDLYGDHLKLELPKTITPNQWAQRILQAISDDRDTCWPTGSTRMGVWLGQHLPGVLEGVVKSRFTRSP